ncbi:MAG: acetyltransferase [Aeromicrobium sp.]|nr:acetyltransferase [Aeromicrobium sp.]
MIVRDATVADLPALLVIHNDAIATTTAIWDEHQVDLDDRRTWLETRQASGLPVLVAEIDGEVAGYASYGPWRPKFGYRFTVENSIYTHPDHQRRGVASALMPELLERARAGEVHSIVAGIESTNAISIALHEKHGFRRVAHLPQVGFKFGRWLDLDYLQLSLGDDSVTG